VSAILHFVHTPGAASCVQETAINIGYACSLITDEMTQFQVTGYSPEVELLEAEGRMEEALLLAGSHVRSELERVSLDSSKGPQRIGCGCVVMWVFSYV
jgi:hypothetical protein